MSKPIFNLAQIDSPIKLLGAIILLVEVILSIVLFNLELTAAERLLIIAGMVLLALIIACFMAYKVSRKDYNTMNPIPIAYDIFLSTAMASLDSQAEYEENRKWLLGIKKELIDIGYKRVFYAADNLKDKNAFDAPALAAEEDINALLASKNFLFIYPAKVNTSAIMELGYALAKNKPIWVFVKNRNDLPYLLRGLDKAYDEQVTITEYTNKVHFETLLKRGVKEAFK